MNIEPLRIEGAYVITPAQHGDDRGVFLEGYRGDALAEHLGYEPHIVQTNISTSARGTLRGIHFADLPPSQAKYVTALAGTLLDVVVDLRVGSPTFGEWESVRLDGADRRAVYLAEGLGHALIALEDDSIAHYLCTATYAPEREHGVNPLDPDLALPIPDDLPVRLSPKDEAAPTLRQARAEGLLPVYEDCVAYVAGLRR